MNIIKRLHNWINKDENTMYTSMEDLPNNLYKYYKYDVQYNEKRLTGEIFFNRPSNFNDVFDAQHEVVNNIDAFQNYSEIKKRLEEIGYSNSSDIISKLKGVEGEKYKMEVRKKQIEHVGITCLTNTSLSILMWAYYTENNGYCIEYDINVIRENIVSLAQKEFEKKGIKTKSTKRIRAGAVSYQHTLPCAPLFFKKGAKNQPYSKYFCKAKCWEHENEYRIALSLLPNTPLKFKSAVKSITFGYNISVEKVQTILTLIANLNLENKIEIYFLKKTRSRDEFEREKFSFTENNVLNNLTEKIKLYQNL